MSFLLNLTLPSLRLQQPSYGYYQQFSNSFEHSLQGQGSSFYRPPQPNLQQPYPYHQQQPYSQQPHPYLQQQPSTYAHSSYTVSHVRDNANAIVPAAFGGNTLMASAPPMD
jgi:hypothetical protein